MLTKSHIIKIPLKLSLCTFKLQNQEFSLYCYICHLSDTFGVGEQVTTTGGDSGGGVDGRSGMLGSFGELLSTLNKSIKLKILWNNYSLLQNF